MIKIKILKMKYFASDFLIEKIEGIKNKLNRAFYFGLVIFIAFSLLMYSTHNQDKFFNFKFISVDLLFLFILAYFHYSNVVNQIKDINKIAIEIDWVDDKIHIITAPINVVFGSNKKSLQLVLKSGEIKILRATYPNKEFSNVSNSDFKLSDSHNQIWVLSEFFDENFIDELKPLSS